MAASAEDVGAAQALHPPGGGPGVMLEEAEDHDDVPAMVDDADEDDQVYDLSSSSSSSPLGGVLFN
jgi:hypothetical protein